MKVRVGGGIYMSCQTGLAAEEGEDPLEPVSPGQVFPLICCWQTCSRSGGRWPPHLGPGPPAAQNRSGVAVAASGRSRIYYNHFWNLDTVAAT